MTAFARICLLLANGAFSKADLRSFGRWVEENGADRLVLTVEKLQNFADDLKTEPSVASVVKGQYEPISSIKIVGQIERLLLDEARLPRNKAIDALLTELKQDGFLPPNFQHTNKTTFRSLITKLGRTIPASDLLHTASKIRNQNVHSNKI